MLKKRKEKKVLYKLCEMNSSEKGEGIFVLEVQIQGANLGNIRLNEILSREFLSEKIICCLYEF